MKIEFSVPALATKPHCVYKISGHITSLSLVMIILSISLIMTREADCPMKFTFNCVRIFRYHYKNRSG